MYGLAGRELRFALIISSVHFSQHFYYRVLPPLIPILAVALEYPLWQLGLLISLYSFGMGLAQAPLGVISDRIDRAYLLPSGIALTGAAYVVFAAAPVLGAGIASIAVRGFSFDGGFLIMAVSMVGVGIGLSVVHPVGYPMISDNTTSTNKGKVLGLFGASSKFGDAATPAIIAGLILVLSWEHIILAFGLAGIAYGIALFLVFREGRYETVPTGQRNGDLETDSGPDEPNDRRSYLYPMVAVYCFFITTAIAASGLNTFLPAFVVDIYAYSISIGTLAIGEESVANLYFSLLLISGAATQLVLGGLTDQFDPRVILLGCMGVAAVGMAILAMVSLHPLLLIVVIVALGAGLYGVNPARDTLISDLSPPEREGRTFGYVFTAVTLTAAPLPTLIGYVLDTVGMREGYLLLAIGPILAAGCIAVLYSDRIYRPTAERTAPSPGGD